MEPIKKKEYSSPELVELGNLPEVTLSGNAGTVDVLAGSVAT